MKINNISMNNINNLYKSRVSKISTDDKQNNEKDSIDISATGKKISSYIKGEISIPEDKKVMEIKHLIEKGKYRIDSNNVAASMILEGKNN